MEQGERLVQWPYFSKTILNVFCIPEFLREAIPLIIEGYKRLEALSKAANLSTHGVIWKTFDVEEFSFSILECEKINKNMINI